MSNRLEAGGLEEVFLLHKRKLRGIAKSVVIKADLVDEVMQDAYLKVVAAAAFDAVRNPVCYCCQIVRNVALDYHRRRIVEAAYRTFVQDIETFAASVERVPERGIDARRALQEVSEVLQALAPRTRQAFELSRLSGLTQREIGRHLGCSATLVNFMIKEADAALAKCRRKFDGD